MSDLAALRAEIEGLLIKEPTLDGRTYNAGIRDVLFRLDRYAAEPLDGPTLARAMRDCEGVNWPPLWLEVEHNMDWVARQVAAKLREYAKP